MQQAQSIFGPIYGLDAACLENTLDVYFGDHEAFVLGSLSCHVMYLPGHTRLWHWEGRLYC
ncbi:hypothetical protein DICSQDRAFT_132821 [Dichomitus squalens LYAD-421 SS1]|uniref:uncharacterized protein n=1 Tax=Dichomitus squalens (strain LYAD-421) TaxID=732165 RepID=UPI0004414E4A|nr:uncharacterized protein DICSQDRAFT_132821 [Dichomitus squalens LYAD-421 SS1]EJF65263.1 hypothetical protein DICSQDRAFT_132821 [Dichomitus squalens LYAD-421 SS1]